MDRNRKLTMSLMTALCVTVCLPFTVCADEPPDLPAVLDLATAQRIAVECSPSLQAAAELVAQAGEKVKQARSLYLPQVDATYLYSNTKLPADMVSGLGGIGGTGGGVEVIIGRALGLIGDSVDQQSVNLTAGLLVFNGFGRKFTNAMARFGSKEAAAAKLEGQRLLLDAVAQAFFAVQLAHQQKAIAESAKAFNARLLHDTKIIRELGKGSTSDVLNFEVHERAAQTAVLQAQGGVERARIALATLMGLPSGMLPETVRIAELSVETPEEMVLPEQDPLLDYALDHRPDRRQRLMGIERADAQLKERYTRFSPSVTAFLSYDGQRVQSSSFGSDQFATTTGLRVTGNLFSGGRRWSEVVEAKHARREAEYRLDEAELKAVSEVRQALVELDIAQKQVVLQRAAMTFVEKNRNLVEKEYDAGKTPLTRLNQAQHDFVTAESHLAMARVALHRGWHGVRTATGETVALDESDD